MHKKWVYLFLFIFILHLAPASYAQAKTQASENPDESSNLERVVQKDGWKVPKIDPNETFQSEVISFQGIPVASRKYRLKRTYDTELDFYILDVEKTLIIKSEIIEVKTIAVYSIGGNTFAYAIVGSPFFVTPEGVRGGIGLLFRAFYFDEDGDGKFETRYTTQTLPIHIPAWAQRITE